MAEKIPQLLAQERPLGTAPVSVFSPKVGEQPFLTHVFVSNTIGQDARYSLYFDDAGSSFNQDTSIVFNALIRRGTSERVPLDSPMANSDGNFAIESDVGGAINFTLFGER